MSDTQSPEDLIKQVLENAIGDDVKEKIFISIDEAMNTGYSFSKIFYDKQSNKIEVSRVYNPLNWNLKKNCD